MREKELLFSFLKHKYPYMSVNEVALTDREGWIRCLTPCKGDSDMCVEGNHYHEAYLRNAVYGERDDKGRFTDPYKFWRELKQKDIFPVMGIREWCNLTGYLLPLVKELT